MSTQQATGNGFQVPPGMMLVPIPQQQQQTQPTVSQYKPPTVTNANSFKGNKVAPPPSAQANPIFNPLFPAACMKFRLGFVFE